MTAGMAGGGGRKKKSKTDSHTWEQGCHLDHFSWFNFEKFGLFAPPKIPEKFVNKLQQKTCYCLTSFKAKFEKNLCFFSKMSKYFFNKKLHIKSGWILLFTVWHFYFWQPCVCVWERAFSVLGGRGCLKQWGVEKCLLRNVRPISRAERERERETPPTFFYIFLISCS